MDALPTLSHAWPQPFDPGAAERLLERFAEQGPAQATLLERPGVRAMLQALGGNSPFLTDLALRESATIGRLVQRGPDPVVKAALREVAAVKATMERPTLAALLRRAKRQIALATAIADIGGAWSLEQVTGALSDLAEAALQASLRHLLHAAAARGALHLARGRLAAAHSGFTVLGMGKLGARELNYSSDIDLVLLYDPVAQPRHAEELGATFTRLARDLCTLMEARDADGYVFRTDLRLRPDPAATPSAMALPAALAYYESAGENWERAAMIKARPVAGDIGLGERFLAEIRPFIWRRHLDFAAVADIRAMKRRMDEHHGNRTGRRAGPGRAHRRARREAGPGRIRGVEFAVQTMQLVWGGRDPALRVPATLPALAALSKAGHVARPVAAEIADAYRFLRQVEHRLQMVADRQTHRLPTDAAGLERFACFMGYPSADAFADALLEQLDRVHQHDAALYHRPNSTSGPVTAASLTQMGFAEPQRVLAALAAWRAGKLRAFRSERARDLLEQVLPDLLENLAAQREPDAAFARADTLLSRLPGGVHVLSLLHRQPVLLERVAALLGAAPSLADHLAQVPAALEGLLALGRVRARPGVAAAAGPIGRCARPGRRRGAGAAHGARKRSSASRWRSWRGGSTPTLPGWPAPPWRTRHSPCCCLRCWRRTRRGSAASRAAAWRSCCWARRAGGR